MEQQVIFREYQEQTSGDHNNLQDFTRRSFDHVVRDAVTRSNRYAGFAVAKTAQVEVQVAAGRLYDQNGAVFDRASTLTQAMTTYLAAAAKRIVTVSVYGQEVETDIQERDFLVNVETGATEPDAVPMTRARSAALVFTAGSESADPQVPPIPATHAVIAHILVDTIQVVSITMQTENEVKSTEGLHTRANALETFRAAIEPRVSALGSDLTALSQQVKTAGDNRAINQLFRDMARVKEALEIPDTASDYGADRFLTTAESDVDNSQALGFDALVQEGIRFPPANAGVKEIDIFSANDPNASLNSGLLLPAFTSQLKMEVGPYHSDLGMAQYGFQTFGVVQRTVARQRIRYGNIYTVCTNSAFWQSGTYDPVTQTFQRNGETFEVLDPSIAQLNHQMIRIKQYWVDSYSETYWDAVVNEYTISGAQVAQTVLIANDTWMTRLGIFFTDKAANENVILTVCELTAGQPDLSKAILHQSIPHADILENTWTVVNTVPTFLKGGTRYAIVLTSNANHRVGMAFGQSYTDGTFFYSTDGAYYQGDLTKDMMIQIWGARFNAPQVTIELEALNLDGGIRNIDILAGMVVPASTQLVFEVQPGGSGAWIALTDDDLTAFNLTPPLARFRARFIGTRDMMPALQLTGSEVSLSRPKTAFTHISEPITLGGASADIMVVLTLEDFDDTPHDCSCRLRVGGVWETPDTTTTETLSLPDGRYERRFNFQLGAPITTFSIEVKGTTNSAGNTYHVAYRVHWATP